MRDLAQWLEYIEGLHPHGIELGLARVRSVWDRISARFDLRIDVPIIMVAGTNGKGSSCAMLGAIYTQAGYRVGVYTSPHLLDFLERCTIGGVKVAPADFVAACAEVEQARCKDGAGQTQIVSLSYFEFTTLAFFLLMARAAKAGEMDVMVLEIGLGGRLDAVNILDADCALITSIDLDHMAYLGPDRQSIGREKAGIMRAGKPVVVSDPMPPQSVIDHAQEIGADLWRVGRDFNFQGDPQQWAWAGRGRRWAGLAYPALRGANQLVNAAGVLAVVEALRETLPVTAQAIRNGLAFVELAGRFQIIAGEPKVVLDVAHNPHSVAALAANLDAMGFYPCTHAVLGAMADKDLTPMLTKMAPIVDRWYFTDLPSPRAASAADLQSRWQSLHIQTKKPSGTYTSPQAAFDAALVQADAADRIVVFGSFYTVGGVMQQGLPRLKAKHLHDL